MKHSLFVRLAGLGFAGCLFLAEVHSSIAQTKFIRLRNETIATEPAPAASRALAKSASPLLSGLVLIQFTETAKPAWREQLQALGVALLHYVPEDAFVARCPAGAANALSQLPFVRWVGPYRADHKVHAALRQLPTDPRGHEVSILVAADAAPAAVAAVRQDLQEAQPESPYHFGTVLRGWASPLRLAALAESDKVLWIERAPRMRLNDEVSSRIVAGAGSVLHHTEMMESGYTGAGVTVAVADSGLDSGDISDMHPDIAGRVAALFYYGTLTDAADEHSHGTHCAGIIAGNGATGETDENDYLYGLGVAPGASLIAQRMFDAAGGYQPPSSFEKLTRDAKRAGADVGSNSWGDDTQGRYDLSAAQFDALVRDADGLSLGDQPYILEFSAGNAGPGYRTIGSPAVAKNVIATGAVNSDRRNLPIEDFAIYDTGPDTMADFSSRGPCEDGRIKPDVVAPGTWIASLRSVYANDENAWWPISDYYMYQGGTSQAGPHVAGAAAVFVQYYRATHAGATPSPALVKAALINSAMDMDDSVETDPAPNMDEGWGRVYLPALIGSTLNYDFTDQTTLLTNGQVFERRIVVAGPEAPLKITIAYTDVPGLPAAVPALVNDLDLEVFAPDGHLYRGNQFEFGESVPDLTSSDTINNVEGVHLFEPVPGEYIIRVRASRVVQDARRDTAGVIDQDFALVISAAVAAPGVGLLTFDKRVYRAPDIIKLRLFDADLAGQSTATLLLRSTNEPLGETILLRASGTNGLFTNNVATATGTALADGKLQVAHEDKIEAVYQDAHPAGTRTNSVRADLLPPVISNVTATNLYGQMVITWDTDEDANGVVSYGTNTPSLSVTNRFFDTYHEVPLEGVLLNRPYKFFVVSEDEAGNRATNDNHGQFFSFTAVQPPNVLLIDSFADWFGILPAPPLSGYTDALNQVGRAYNVFDATGGAVPSLAQLLPYRCVIWRISDLDAPSATLARNITNYLGHGGSLLLASMEAATQFDGAGMQSFRSNVLQVRSYTYDQPVDVVTGTSGDPVGAGINVTLDYSPYEEILMLAGTDTPSDWIVPTANALATFSSGLATVGIRSPKPGHDLPGRVVFLSFPLDAVPLGVGLGNNRGGLLRNVLNYLDPPAGNSTLTLDSDVYTVPSRATVEVEDGDLAGLGQTTVTFTSSRQTNAVTVTLNETTRSGLFRGGIWILPVSTGPGTIAAQTGDTIQASYLDASSSHAISGTATIETAPPVISAVAAEPDYIEAIISWDTSELTDALVQYSDTPAVFLSTNHFPDNFTAYDDFFDTSHELLLSGLKTDHTYYYRVVSRDRAGNTTVDDNRGLLYTFRTLLPITPPWTDNMENGLNGWTVQTDPEIESQVEWTLGVPGGGVTAHSPPTCWGCNLAAEAHDWAESYLLSPAIDLTGGNHATLRFWHWADFGLSDGLLTLEGGEVMLYISSSGTLVTLESITDYVTDWEELEYDLSPYTGDVVYVVFHYVLFAAEDTDSTGWLIDDVSVTLDTVAPGTVVVTNNLSQAFFDLAGPRSTNGSGSWTVVSNAPPGQYIVEFGDVQDYITPSPQTNTLVSGSVLLFAGNYTFADTNHNGVSDVWERRYFGSAATNSATTADSDRDGVSDHDEFIAGTNPTDSNSVLRVRAAVLPTSGEAQLNWTAAPGRAYRILNSDDALHWSPVTDWQRANEGGAISFKVLLPPGTPSRFYRLEVRP